MGASWWMRARSSNDPSITAGTFSIYRADIALEFAFASNTSSSNKSNRDEHERQANRQEGMEMEGHLAQEDIARLLALLGELVGRARRHDVLLLELRHRRPLRQPPHQRRRERRARLRARKLRLHRRQDVALLELLPRRTPLQESGIKSQHRLTGRYNCWITNYSIMCTRIYGKYMCHDARDLIVCCA